LGLTRRTLERTTTTATKECIKITLRNVSTTIYSLKHLMQASITNANTKYKNS